MLRSAVVALLIGALPPVTSGVPSRAALAREEAVFAAVVRQQIKEHLDPSERARGPSLRSAGKPDFPSFCCHVRWEKSLADASAKSPLRPSSPARYSALFSEADTRPVIDQTQELVVDSDFVTRFG